MTPCNLVVAASPDHLGLFDAMHSQRAIRYCKPDPVPNDLIQRTLEAAILPVSQVGDYPLEQVHVASHFRMVIWGTSSPASLAMFDLFRPTKGHFS